MKTRLRADLALLFVSFSWGLTFPAIRSAMAHVDPPRFLAARFGVATAGFLLVWLVARRDPRALRAALGPGALLGVVLFGSYLFQTIGLTTVGAGRGAFVTGLNVVLVPLLAPLFRAGRPKGRDVVAALVATAGMYLLTGPGGGGLTVGDAWILACAFAYAGYIHLLQRAVKLVQSALDLAFLQAGMVFLLSALSLPVAATDEAEWTGTVWLAVAFCAVVATVGTFWLHARYQRDTTPERAALLFATEPVFAAVFAWFLLGETMTLVQLAGAGVILLTLVPWRAPG